MEIGRWGKRNVRRVETDALSSLAFLQPQKGRKSSSSRTGACSASERNGSVAGRNVTGGRRVEHVGEDGMLWMDVEEEVRSLRCPLSPSLLAPEDADPLYPPRRLQQEWTWLLSEIGHGGQPLVHWPQHFSSHLHPCASSPTSATFPTIYTVAETLAEENEDDALLSHSHPDEDHSSVWTVLDSQQPKIVSALDMPKASTSRPSAAEKDISMTDSNSDDSSHHRHRIPSKSKAFKSKYRPEPLKLASTLSSSLLKSQILLSPIVNTTIPTSTPTRPQPIPVGSSKEGRTLFLSSTVVVSPAQAATSTSRLPSSSYTITVGATGVTRERTSSMGSRKSVRGEGTGRKEGKGLGIAVKGFFSRK
jgi:hypothetical protein